MKSLVKFLVNGASLSLLREGYFSDVHVQLSEELEALLDKIQRYGDAKISEVSKELDSYNIKSDFEHLLGEFDKYDLLASDFIQDQLNINPELTFGAALEQLRDKFL